MEYLHEVFDEAEKKKNLTERKKFLAKYKNRPAVREILRISYHPNIQPLLPVETDPPYRPSELEEGLTDFRIDSELRRLRIFLRNGGYNDMNQVKREALFIELLEGLHKREAEILLKAFQKKFRIKGMKAEHINEVFGTDIPVKTKKETSKVEA